MELREMNDVRAARLESLHEAGRFESARNAIRLLLLLRIHESLRVFDVIMAREGEMAGQFLETIAVCVARH